MAKDDNKALFETCRHLQLRANHTRKSEDIAPWMRKYEEIQDKGLERQYELWFIEQQEERCKEWNIQESLRRHASGL